MCVCVYACMSSVCVVISLFLLNKRFVVMIIYGTERSVSWVRTPLHPHYTFLFGPITDTGMPVLVVIDDISAAYDSSAVVSGASSIVTSLQNSSCNTGTTKTVFLTSEPSTVDVMSQGMECLQTRSLEPTDDTTMRKFMLDSMEFTENQAVRWVDQFSGSFVMLHRLYLNELRGHVNNHEKSNDTTVAAITKLIEEDSLRKVRRIELALIHRDAPTKLRDYLRRLADGELPAPVGGEERRAQLFAVDKRLARRNQFIIVPHSRGVAVALKE
jgi:hypothetical protein